MRRWFTTIYSIFLGSILIACQDVISNSQEGISDTSDAIHVIEPMITLDNAMATNLPTSSIHPGKLEELPLDWEYRLREYLNTNGMVNGNASPDGSLALAIIRHPTATQSITVQVQTLIGPQEIFTHSIKSDTSNSYMEYLKEWSPDNKTALVRSHNSTNDCLYGLVTYTLDVATHELHRTKLKPVNEKQIYCYLQEAAWSPDGSQLMVFSDFASSLFVMETNGNVLHTIPLILENGDKFEGLQWTPQGVFFSIQNNDSSRLYQLQIEPNIQQHEVIFAQDANLTFVSLDPTSNRILLNDTSKSLRLIIYNVDTKSVERIIQGCIGHFDPWNNEPIGVPYVGINCFSGGTWEQLIFDWQTKNLTEFNGFASRGWFTNLGGFLMEKSANNDWIIMKTIH